MEWPTRECGNVASVLACNFRPPWFYRFTVLSMQFPVQYVHLATLMSPTYEYQYMQPKIRINNDIL
jgi:hypothetical protein